MFALFGLVLWAGYGVGSYGWVLLKGYDVSAASWFSPVGTFDWRSNPGFVAQGKVFPGQAPGSGSGNDGGGITITPFNAAPFSLGAQSSGGGAAAGTGTQTV